MNDAFIIALCTMACLIFVIYRQQKIISELSNKLMSHDYRDYVAATKPAPPPRVELDPEPVEDLRHITDFRVT